ncbi:hypothetical protein K439DRAFT_1625510, partial [Ramaria rubella]
MPPEYTWITQILTEWSVHPHQCLGSGNPDPEKNSEVEVRIWWVAHHFNSIDESWGDATLPFRKPGWAGQPPRVRIGDHRTKRNEILVEHLPENFYNMEWLNLHHPKVLPFLDILPPIKLPKALTDTDYTVF